MVLIGLRLLLLRVLIRFLVMRPVCHILADAGANLVERLLQHGGSFELLFQQIGDLIRI